MIDLIEDHFEPTWGGNHSLTVGGIVGTAIFKHAIHACMKYHDYHKILVIDGCQDYIGLLRKPVFNYVYYMSIFRTVLIPHIDKLQNPAYHFLVELQPGVQIQINEEKIFYYDAIIVNNAHLIPKMYLDALDQYFHKKILYIVDPLDLTGESFSTVPTLYDSLSKQTTLVAMARSMYGIGTRAIDRKIPSDFKKIKMPRRSIGRIDATQYVTNSEVILNQINEKQINSNYRKNQKFIVASNQIHMFRTIDELPVVVGPRTMFSISNVTRPLMKLRIHSSTKQFHALISYRNTQNALYVKPANILKISSAIHHRFQTINVVLGEEPMTNRLWYAIMKIANHINVIDY